MFILLPCAAGDSPSVDKLFIHWHDHDKPAFSTVSKLSRCLEQIVREQQPGSANKVSSGVVLGSQPSAGSLSPQK